MESVSISLMGEVEKAVRENPDAVVCLVDSDGIFAYMSPSVEGYHGYKPEEAIGHQFTEFFPPNEASHLELGLQDALLTGQSVELTRNVKHKSGGTRRMRGAAHRLFDEASGNFYVLSIGRPCGDA